MQSQRLNQICGSFRVRLKIMLALSGLARVVLTAIVMTAVICFMDYLVHFGRFPRAIALLLLLGGVGVVTWFTMINPLRRKWSNRDVLSYADAVLPPGEAMLLDLYELTHARDQIQESTTPTGQSLIDAAVDDLARRLNSVRLAGTLRKNIALSWLLVAIAVIMVTVAMVAVDEVAALNRKKISSEEKGYAETGARRLLLLSDVLWPHNTTIKLYNASGDDLLNPCAVPQLDTMTIKGEVTVLTGEVPAEVVVWQRPQGHDKFEQMPPIVVTERKFKDAKGDEHTVHEFTHTFPKVRDPLDFKVAGGDFETKEYSLGIISRPYIEWTEADLKFPNYANVPDKTEKSKQLKVLEGTNINMRFKCNMPLKSAKIVPSQVEGAQPTTMPEALLPELRFTNSEKNLFSIWSFNTQKGKWEEGFFARDNWDFNIELVEANGYKQAGEERVSIVVDRDKPPTVHLLSPAADLVQTNKAAVDVYLQAEDDYGLAKVEVVYQLDNGPETVLDDKISGLEPGNKGKRFQHRFNWQLRKSDIPEKGRLNVFVRVKDVNPIADRGWAKSETSLISLVKPTEFHLAILEQAKGLLQEARLAWLHQNRAWVAGQKYLKSGTGGEDDPTWTSMLADQGTSFDAAKQMRTQLKWLTEQYERNQMSREFMSARLAPIAALINQMIDEEHKSIAAGLLAAKPPTAADAEAARLLDRRRTGLGKFGDNQKIAVLLGERIIAKLYDWSDLQLATVTTTLMAEQQEDVNVKTEELAKKYAGRQREDLDDRELDEVLTVGKQQRAVYDTETQLQKQMDDMIFWARMQKRASVYKALWAAWTVLTDNRVNDKLKTASELIENNQPSECIGDQKRIVQLFRLVETGLIAAGERIEDDGEKITLAMAPQPEKDFDPRIRDQRPEQPPDPNRKPPDGGDTIKPEPPDANTALSMAIASTIELQDSVRGRLFYLANNHASSEMPRFILLKELMLIERQAIAASKGLDEAIKLAQTAGSDTTKSLLASQKEEMTQLISLIGAHDVGGCHRRSQENFIGNLKDLLSVLAWEKDIDGRAAEKKSGIDAFGRQYVLRGQDLDNTVGMIARLNHALALEQDVVRKLDRFASSQPEVEPAVGLEKTNRQRAAAMQKQVSELVDAVAGQASSMSGEVAEYINKTGVPGMKDLNLGSYCDPIASAKVTREQVEELRMASGNVLNAMQNLRDVMEERVKPPVTTEPDDVDKKGPITPPTIDDLSKGMDNSGIPAPMIERMKRAMSKGGENGEKFPALYGGLLRDYYASFSKKQKEKAVEGEPPPPPPKQ